MPLSTDTFNRTNNTSSLGTTDGAGSLDPLTWTQSTGTMGIISNTAYASSIPGSRCFATVDLGTADVDASVTISTIGQSGLLFRWSDSTHFWIWIAISTSSFLFKFDPGAGYTQVGTTQTGAANGDVMRVVANGSAIEVFRNGTSKITTTDSYAASGTNHGLYFQSASDLIDAFSASNLVSGMIFTGTQATETDTA